MYFEVEGFPLAREKGVEEVRRCILVSRHPGNRDIGRASTGRGAECSTWFTGCCILD